MKHEKKFSSQEQQVSETQSRQTMAREFSSVEELLRFDAGQTTVPPAIAERLQKSAAQINPPAARPWWKNLFGAKS
jgi:hypothetical protein